jgi:hypothetical protein
VLETFTQSYENFQKGKKALPGSEQKVEDCFELLPRQYEGFGAA